VNNVLCINTIYFNILFIDLAYAKSFHERTYLFSIVWCVYQVEYMLVHLDHEQKRARLLLKAQPILQELMEEEVANPKYVTLSL